MPARRPRHRLASSYAKRSITFAKGSTARDRPLEGASRRGQDAVAAAERERADETERRVCGESGAEGRAKALGAAVPGSDACAEARAAVGRFVAGGEQQAQEAEHVLVVEPRAFELRLRQHADDVVLRLRAAGLDDRRKILAEPRTIDNSTAGNRAAETGSRCEFC